MGGVKLGFEIAAGFLLFGLAVFLIMAAPGWFLAMGVLGIDRLRKELSETFRKKTFVDGLIGLGIIGTLVIVASIFSRR